MSEAQIKQVAGVCVSVTERNGWTEFEIDHGNQHPTKLSTKLQPLIELGRAARQEHAVWTYKESDGNENPNRPGTFYKNRYLEKVEVGAGPAHSAATPAPAPQPGGIRAGGTKGGDEGLSKEEWARKDSAADKRACIAIAVGALTHTMPADPSPDDLAKFIGRVKFLSHEWHTQVEAVRAGDDSDVPFSPYVTQEDAVGIPY